ncbi:MAG: peroxidase family protein, partial [Myxococcota bacterium]
EVPDETLSWQDPIPAVDHPLVSGSDVAALKKDVLASGLTVSELVRTAWASASSFRASDMRGGANGARVRLEPMKSWAVNTPAELDKVMTTLGGIKEAFDAKGAKKISLADLVVLGGAAAVEKAASDAGTPIEVPFVPGRMDASQEQTDVVSFANLEPVADGFRNYVGDLGDYKLGPAALLVDKADLLDLTVSEMTVLVGGLRALDANTGGSDVGILTDRPGQLTTDFFVNLLDMSTAWAPKGDGTIEGRDRSSGDVKWTATEVDLVFGSNSELRAVAEVYALEDGKDKFLTDFVAAWTKVMTADRFDLN